MMGPTQRADEKLFYYGINLDKRVRPDNPLRRISDKIDFSFVREAVADSYGKKGHESEDPIVIMKLMLLLFFDDVASERELMRIVGERLDYMWFLGFGLEDEIPNHSVLSKARKRWGAAVFEDLFVRIVQQCVEVGLVDGKKIHMDSSLIEANASRESVRTALQKVYGEQEQKLDEDPEGGRWLESRTDPDAAVVGRGRQLEARPRYKTHRAIDDQSGVITAIKTTPADRNEGHELPTMVEIHEHHVGRRTGTVIADAQYGTYENFLWCRKRGIRSHMADLQDYKKGQEPGGLFGREHFCYDKCTDTYECPAGERLRHYRISRFDRVHIYKAEAAICQACQLRTKCTRGLGGRMLRRPFHQELIEKAQRQSHSPAAQRDRRRRRYLMEGSFADATNNHGFKRSRWRRLWRQQIQDLLIACCQNLRILLSSTGPSPQALRISSSVLIFWLLRTRQLMQSTSIKTKMRINPQD
jgi:transposase